jgi:ribonuclease HI
MKKLIYTDGASSGNPGPGGYAAVITDGQHVLEVGDYEPKTTNNRMELKAAIEGLKNTEVGDTVKIITDSTYMGKGITEWMAGWVENGWMTKGKVPVSNKDLWQELHALVEDRKVEWRIVKGHASTSGNNRVDMLATTFSTEVVPHLYNGPKSEYKIDLTEPSEAQVVADKNGFAKTSKASKNSKAYSYLSLVDNKLEKHKTWAECENRVKGRAGARFRKAISPEDELDILKGWGIK